MASKPGIRRLYLTRGEVQALDWIRQNTNPGDLFLASPETGLLIPAYTGRRVLYGHPFETVDAEIQRKTVESYFSDGITGEAEDQLFGSQGIGIFFMVRGRLA